MPKSKDTYRVSGSTRDEILLSLNFALQMISDRLDKIEGLRGTLETSKASFSGDVTANADVIVKDGDGKKIHSME